MDPLALSVVPGLKDLRDADKLRGRENRAWVDLVGDEVDVLPGHEVEDFLEDVALDRGPERVGGVGDEDSSHPQVQRLGVLIGSL